MKHAYERPAQKNKRVRRAIAQWAALAAAAIIGLALLWPYPVVADPAPTGSSAVQPLSLPIIPDKPIHRGVQRQPARAETASRVRAIALESGYTENEVNALLQLLMIESGINPSAQNPRSSAYGLFQFLDSTWASTGVKKTSSLEGQMEAGLMYIANRYGTPEAALQFQISHNWY